MEVSIGEFKSPEWPDLCSLRLGGNHETARTLASWRSPSHVMSPRASHWSEDRARWKSSVAHKYTVRVAMSSDLSDSIPGFQGSSLPLSLKGTIGGNSGHISTPPKLGEVTSGSL